MPRIDYQTLRSQVPMRRVLALIGYTPLRIQGDQWRGRCPLRPCRSDSPRCFSAHLTRHIYRCFACGSQGNALDLWRALTGLPLHQAAQQLCHELGLPVPVKPRSRNSKTQSLPTTTSATRGQP
jgi:DNA primase